jgi:hypothetical protein
MYGSLFWIEWLDRLDRVLTSASQDVAAVMRVVSPRSLAAIERSARQLSALSSDLRLLDRDVLATSDSANGIQQADNLQMALDTALMHLNAAVNLHSGGVAAQRERVLTSLDASLRDARYEAVMLLEPARRRA